MKNPEFPNHPLFLLIEKRPKTCPGWPKNGENFVWPFLSKGRVNHWARYSEPKKTDFFLLELENLAKFGHFGRLGQIWL